MKYLINLVGLLCGIIALNTCNLHVPQNKSDILEYNNILIYSDLSSRTLKSPNDTMVINQLIDYFINDCVKPGIKVNDRSSIYFSRVNFFKSNCPSSEIDISGIANLKEKQLFVNNNSKTRNLTNDIIAFKTSIRCNYQERDKGGIDILSLLYNEINNGNHIKKTSYLYSENDTTTILYNNHLFVFTDGYLEFSKKDGNIEYFFGQPEIQKVRKYCVKNKIAPIDAIKNNPEFKLRPLKSDNNKFINLYVMETYDRGLNEQKGTLKHTGDLSDNNILKIVWETWAIESGFKHFIWKQFTRPTSLPKDYIKTIIIK